MNKQILTSYHYEIIRVIQQHRDTGQQWGLTALTALLALQLVGCGGGGGGSGSSGGGETPSDIADFSDSTEPVNVNLETSVATGGGAEGYPLKGIENVIGSAYADILTGNDKDNSLIGNAGIDSIYGEGGDDTLTGGAGADIIDGGYDSNTAAGIDTASYAGSSEYVVVNLMGENKNGDAEGDMLSNIKNITGSANDDILSGNNDNNILVGGDGNDTLEGRGGADILNGGTGSNTVSYASSSSGVYVNLATSDASGGDAAGDLLNNIDNLIGSDYIDTLIGDANDNILEGGADADTIDGGPGNDTASYTGSSEAVSIDLSTGTVSGGDAAGDLLNNIDNLIGSAQDDELTGSANNNTLEGGAGADIINGGTGSNTASYASSSEYVVVNLMGENKNGDAEGDMLSNIKNITGSANDDILSGNNDNNILVGGDGNDTLEGRVGADILNGGTGSNTVSYASSSSGVYVNLATSDASGGDAAGDLLNNIDNLIGSDYIDTLIGDANDNILEGGADADTIDGGAGNDTASYAGSSEAVSIDLSTHTVSGGDAAGDLLKNIDNLIGSAQDDELTGSANNNTLEGGAGADILNGGDGINTVSYASSSSGVYVDLLGENQMGDADGDTLTYFQNIIGSANNDSLSGDDNNNILFGGDGDDDLTGKDGDDTLYGMAGSDSLNGYTGADTLYGGAGVDYLYGDEGNDSLTGGDGEDYLFGNIGSNTLTDGPSDTNPTEFNIDISDKITSGITETDTITDFETTIDVIKLRQGNHNFDNSSLRGDGTGKSLQSGDLDSAVSLNANTGLLINTAVGKLDSSTIMDTVNNFLQGVNTGDALFYLQSNGINGKLYYLDFGDDIILDTTEVREVVILNGITDADNFASINFDDFSSL